MFLLNILDKITDLAKSAALSRNRSDYKRQWLHLNYLGELGRWNRALGLYIFDLYYVYYVSYEHRNFIIKVILKIYITHAHYIIKVTGKQLFFWSIYFRLRSEWGKEPKKKFQFLSTLWSIDGEKESKCF